MKKYFFCPALVSLLAFFLQACTIPPAPIKWRTDPGRIQQVNVSALSPASPHHAQFFHEMN